MNEHKKGVRAKKLRVASIEPSKPRNFVAKNAMATTSGAGAHKDKKKAMKQGDVKHKKLDYAESLELRLAEKLSEEKVDEFVQALAPAAAAIGRGVVAGARTLGTVAGAATRAVGSAVSNAFDDEENTETEEDVDSPEYNDEAGMSYGSLHTIARAADGLLDTIKEGDNLPEWCQEKISLAEDYLITVWDYLQSEKAQGIAEGSDPWGPEGRYVGDTGPTQVTTTVDRVQLKPGDKVLYKPTEQRATIEAMSKDSTQARIHIATPMGGKTFNCKTSDLKTIGQGVAEGTGQQLSVQQLAQISDAALDSAYGYGRSQPGNTFGWQANLKSAAFAKQMIDKGVTDVEAISDAIHKGWNVTAQAFVQNPDQFDDSKTMAPEKLQAKIAQRQKLMTQNYAQLPEDEKEKDRVVARAMLQAITGDQGVAEKLNLKAMDTGAVIKDFEKSNAPQFRGKTKEKRRQMAIAAKMGAMKKKKKIGESVEEWTTDSLASHLFEQELTYEDRLNNMLSKKLSK